MTGATYDDFVEDLKEAEDLRQCRYGVFDAEYKLKDGQSRQKLVFFLWYATSCLVDRRQWRSRGAPRTRRQN